MKRLVSLLAVALLALVAVVVRLSAAEPTSAAEACRRGQSCNANRDFDGAVVAYTQAIAVDPNSAEAYCGRCSRPRVEW